MRKTLLTVVLSAAALVAGCTSASKATGSAGPLPANSFRAQWTRDLHMQHDAPRQMYVRGDYLVVYSSQNLVYNINRISGNTVYISDHAKPGTTIQPPLLTPDGLIIPTETRLDFLNARGVLDHSLDVKSSIRTGVVSDGVYYYLGINAADGSGRLVALDPHRPYSPSHWELMTGGPVTGTPAIFQKVIYCASYDGRVYAVNPDRTAAWSINRGVFITNGAITSDLFVDKTGVYIASEDGKLYCLDPASGRIRWQYQAGAPLFDAPVVTNSAVYVRVRDPGIACLDKGAGAFSRTPRWFFPNATKVLAEGDKLVFLLGSDNEILAVDKATGKLAFSSVRKDMRVFALNPLDEVIYGATKDGQIVAAVAVTKFGTVGQLVWCDVKDLPTLLASR